VIFLNSEGVNCFSFWPFCLYEKKKRKEIGVISEGEEKQIFLFFAFVFCFFWFFLLRATGASKEMEKK
jgi:hypothetical protein